MTSGGEKSWAAGLQVGRYVLQKVIARGGMAEIWLAQQPGPRDFARAVVIKRILTEGLTSDFEQLFFDEAKVASQLNHPNIVQVYEFDEFEGTPYLVMEALVGDTLGALLRKVALRGEALPPKLAVAIALRCAQGLGSAHRKLGPDGKPLLVVHRDVSPQNIFVTGEGLVKVLDFGIARAVGRVTTTAVGMVRGKPHYMAPEQALGNAVAASDVFSLGVVLFELLTGRRLYGDADHLDVFRQLVLGETPTPGPMDVNRAVPADLDALVRKMMERRLEHRFYDGVVCAEALEEWQRRNQVSMSDYAIAQWVQSLDGAGAVTVPIPAVTAAMLAEASHRDRGPGAVAGVRAVPPLEPREKETDPVGVPVPRSSAPRPSAPRAASSAATVVEAAVAPELVEAARRKPGSDASARVADPSRRSPGSDAAAGAAGPVESQRGALASQGAARAADPSRRSPASDAAASAAAPAHQEAPPAPSAPRQRVASAGAAPVASGSPAPVHQEAAPPSAPRQRQDAAPIASAHQEAAPPSAPRQRQDAAPIASAHQEAAPPSAPRQRQDAAPIASAHQEAAPPSAPRQRQDAAPIASAAAPAHQEAAPPSAPRQRQGAAPIASAPAPAHQGAAPGPSAPRQRVASQGAARAAAEGAPAVSAPHGAAAQAMPPSSATVVEPASPVVRPPAPLAPASPATVVEPALPVVRPPAAETRVEQPVSSTLILPAPSAPRPAAPAPAPARAPAAPPPQAARARPSRGLAIGLLAVGAVVSAVLIAFGLGRRVESAATVAPPTPAPTPTPPIAALVKEPAPATPIAAIELKLSTKPADVQVEVDGLLVGRTPLALKGKEGDIVVVTLSAPGYAKMERKILLSRQLSELKLELEKAKAVKPKPSTKDLKDPYSNELVDDPY